MQFEIQFTGHKNIRSSHKKTIEITTESNLTPQGDCIIGVNALCGCKGFPKEFKKKLKDRNANVIFSVIVNGHTFNIKGKGHENLLCSHPTDIVLRKSSFVCPRTIAVKCDKASDSIPRYLVKLLQNSKTKGRLIIKVK